MLAIQTDEHHILAYVCFSVVQRGHTCGTQLLVSQVCMPLPEIDLLAWVVAVRIPHHSRLRHTIQYHPIWYAWSVQLLSNTLNAKIQPLGAVCIDIQEGMNTTTQY